MKRYLSTALIIIALTFGIPTAAHANAALTKNVSADPSRVAAAKSRPFTLVQGKRKWTAPASEISKWFKTTGDGSTIQLRPGAIYNYLNTKVSPVANDLGENSRFSYVGSNLHLIKGGRKGKIVDGVKTSLAIRSAIVSGKTSATVHMKTHRPSIFSASDYTKLSFPTLLTSGQTNFAGSPANRIHNINVATARYNGLVIMPGEEFSFNQYLGEVDASNGYKKELVIKNNTTTPEYGGGICQISTTAFRAALQAGLEITSRRNHSYAVSYYGTPGFDATVYSPTTDFKFRNDTGNAIQLKTRVAGTNVIFDVWGTSDGRNVKINGPFVTSKKADGSSTAAIAQIVTNNGKTIREKNFVSHYQSADKFPTVKAQNGG